MCIARYRSFLLTNRTWWRVLSSSCLSLAPKRGMGLWLVSCLARGVTARRLRTRAQITRKLRAREVELKNGLNLRRGHLHFVGKLIDRKVGSEGAVLGW